MAVGATVPLTVRALNRAGDVIPGATITLTSLTPTIVAIPTGQVAVEGLAAGSGRVVAAAGDLVSDPLAITVTAP